MPQPRDPFPPAAFVACERGAIIPKIENGSACSNGQLRPRIASPPLPLTDRGVAMARMSASVDNSVLGLDRATLERLLARAEGGVSDAYAVVLRQRLLVGRLAHRGPPGMLDDAKRLLIQFEDLLGLVVVDRDRLRQELDEASSR